MRSWWLKWRLSPVEGSETGHAEPSDAELVRAYQQDRRSAHGRQAAARLLARYQRRVLSWCWRLVGDRDTALDMAQDALLSVWTNLERFDASGSFGAWVFMVTRNRCFSELRRRRVPLADAAVLQLVADQSPGPDRILEQQLLGEELARLLKQHLSEQEQDAVWMRCYEGLSVETITRRLGLQEASGARGLLQRARRKLRAAVARGEGADQ